MNKRQKLFADKYVECFNATEAYKYAYPKVSDTTAASNGYKLLRNTEIAAYINEKIESFMTRGEVLKLLADEARGEDKKIRIKALELLGKHYVLFTDRIEGSLNHTVSWADFVNSDAQTSHE